MRKSKRRTRQSDVVRARITLPKVRGSKVTFRGA